MILDIVAEINNQFKLYQPNIGMYFGRASLNKTMEANRIVWYPVRDEFTPTMNIGKNPIEVFSKDVTLEFHIFSKDQNKIDNMVNDLIISIYEKVFEPQMVELFGEYLDLGQEDQQGFGYILTVTISGIIIRRPLRTTEIETVEDYTHYNNSSEYVPPMV